MRNMAAHKSRTFLTGLGIALGVAVVLSVNITNATLMASFNAVFDEAGGKADLTVIDQARGGNGFDADILRIIEESEYVIAAAPMVLSYSLVADDLGGWQASGSATGTIAAGNALLIMGVDSGVDGEIRETNLVKGRLLEPGETRYSVVLVERYAQEKDYDVGDKLPILLPESYTPTRLTIVGLIDSTGAGLINGGVIAFLPLPVAQELLQRADRFDRVDVVLRDEIAESSRALTIARDELTDLVGENVRVLYPGARGEELAKRMASYRLGLDLFSTVAMFIGGFLIYNTFAMNIAERTRQIGLLRAIGMTRWQVLVQILIEAVLLSIAGSTVGLFMGMGMAYGMSATVGFAAGSTISGLTIPTVGFSRSLAIGLGVTIISALWPSLQAAAISPLQALRARAQVGGSDWRRYSWRFGPGMLVVGWLVFNSLPLRDSIAWSVVSAAALVFLFGAAISVPILDQRMGKALQPLITRIFGKIGMLGSANLARAQGRTIITVATLMLGIAINIGVVSLGDSFRYDLGRWTEAATGGDLIVRSPVRLRYQTKQRLSSITGVDLVSAERIVEVWTSGVSVEDEIVFVAIEPESRQQISQFIFENPTSGSEAEAFIHLDEGDTVFISTSLAGRYHLSLGDAITLDTPRGPHSFRIVGVVLDFNGNGLMVYGSWGDLRRYFGVDDVDRFIVKLSPGFSPEQIGQYIESTLGDRLNLTVDVVEDLLRSVLEITDQSFIMFDTLALIIVSVSAMGVVNTMAISVMERRHEIAMLRAIGLTRRQVITMILAEAATLGALGGALGLALGLIFSRMLIVVVQHLMDYELTYRLSTRALISSAVIALVISQLAALIPAARAAKQDIVIGLSEQ
jgi:putative ABC transport system permease protein